jgi:hypothetical protein
MQDFMLLLNLRRLSLGLLLSEARFDLHAETNPVNLVRAPSVVL